MFLIFEFEPAVQKMLFEDFFYIFHIGLSG